MKRTLRCFVFSTSILAVLLTAACSNSPPPISVSIAPSSTQTIDEGQAVSVSATVLNDSADEGVTWALTGPGTLSFVKSTSALYNAPAAVSGPESALVTAISVADPKETAVLVILVNPPPQITASGLGAGDVGTAYSSVIPTTGGTAPLSYSMVYGALPAGLTLDSSTGAVSGTPAKAGTWYFIAVATDAYGLWGNAVMNVSINPSGPPGNPVPLVSQPLFPDAAAPGSSGLSLAVNGVGFVSGASVDFNGAPLSTTFVSSNHLTAEVPSSDLTKAGTASITVVNPVPGGGPSNAVPFPVAAPESTVTFSPAPGSPITIADPIYTIGPAGFPPDAVAAGYLTASKNLDLVVANSGGQNVMVLLGNGDGTFAQAPGSPVKLSAPPWNTAQPLSYPDSVAIGNFTTNGKPDLAVPDSARDTVAALLGNGDGTFTPSTASVEAFGDPVGIVAGDFNGDGFLDFATPDALGNMEILLGFGDGAFNEAFFPITSISGYPSSIAEGNFGGGRIDLAVASAYVSLQNAVVPGAVTVLLNKGGSTFATAPGSPITVGDNPSAIVAGDFNGDGKLDLAVANENDNTVTILLGNGDGTFTQAPGSPIAVGNGPDALAVGDFTGNGKLDLAVANFASGTVTILLGNGVGAFTEAAGSPFAVGKGPTSIAVGDFNDSGRLGLAVTNLQDGTLSILLQP